MAKNSYVNANLTSTYDTFANWLVKTNEIIYDMGTSVVTVNSSATADVTTGNGYVNGFFGSNTLYVFSDLHGGTPTAKANLNISSNVVVTSNVFISANLLVTGTANVTVNLNSVGIVSNNVSINNNLTVTNTATLNTATAVTANITTANIVTLGVTGVGTAANLNVTNTANLNNANIASANITTLGVTGLSTLVNVSIGTGTSNVQANTTQLTIANPSATASVNATSFSGTAANATLLNSQNGAFYTNASNMNAGVLPWAHAAANTVNTTGAFTITGVRTHNANLVVNAVTLSVGNSTVNVTSNTTTLVVGNSTANAAISTTGLLIANATSNLTLNPLTLTVNAGTTTGRALVNSTVLSVGNATVNSTITSTGLSFNGTVVANSTVFARQANGATNLGPEGTGVSLATLQSQITSNSANVVTYLTTNAYNISGVITHNANLVVNTANRLFIGNNTVNATANQTTLYLANSTTNTSISPGVVTFGGGATVNSTIYSGTANNANALGGYVANTTSPSDGFVLAYNLAENTIKWANPAGITVSLSSNTLIVNAQAQIGSNGSTYVATFTGNATSTNTVIRSNNISLAVDSGNIRLNSNTLVSNSLLVSNTTANVIITTSQITIQNSTTSSVLTQNSFSRQANGATNLGPEGSGVTLSTLQSQFTSNDSTTYTNAITYSANATNINTGTLAAGRLPATIVNTSGAFTITGVHTRNANLIMNTANQILLGNATVNAVANQTSLAIYNSSSNVVANATTIVVGGTATINSTAFSRQANGATNFGPEGTGVTLSTLQTQITSNSANVVTYITTNNYTISGNVNFTGTTIGIGTATPSTSYKVDVVGNGRFSTGLEVSGGKSIFTEGSISGSAQGYVDYDFLIDFGSDVANTWRKIVTIASPNIQYSTIGFKIDIVEPKSNHATTSSINNIITETYYVACVRANDTTLNTPDACYISGPGNRIRAVKTSTGNYEIQIQNAAQFVEYRGRISVYAVNGTHTVTYSNGTSAATGTAQYNASDSTNGIQRISGALHVSGNGGIRAIAAPTQDSVQISGRAGGTSSYVATITPTTLSASRTLTIPDVSGTIVTTGDSATVTNAMLAGSIADSKLSTISTADKVSVSALNIDGATDIGAAIADADLFIVDDGGAGANRKTAATRIRDYALNGNNFLSVMESLRANRAVHGGGTITVDSSNNVKWSNRFIVISNGYGSHFSTNGYFDIECPTSGTITGVGGATNKTATSNGIPLAPWEALYYILPIGSSSATVNGNFRVASYTSSLEIPSDWILICASNGDLSNFYFPNGIILKANQSFASGTVTTASFWHAGNDGPGSGLDADLLDGLNSGSFLRSDTGTAWNGSAGGTFRITCPAGASGTTGGGINSLEIFQPTPNADATINLHVSTDFGCHFGLDGTTNDLFVGGWSFGAVKHKVWHAGNDGSGSGLDADLLDGLNSSSASSASTIVARDSSSRIYGYRGAVDTNANWNTGFSNTPVASKNFHGDISGGGPQGSWWFYESMRHSNATNLWGTQIAWGWEDNANELWQRNVSGGTFSSWVRYWNSSNDGALASKAQTLTNKRIDPRVSSAASGDISPTIASFDQYNRTALSAAITINAPTGTPVNGNKLMFRLRDNGSARALTWNGTYRAVGVTLPTTTTASKTTYVGCIYNSDENTWDVIAVSTQA